MGLLGGSFNPAHDGHRHISQLALTKLNLDRVWWLVSPQNPLKQRAGMAPLEIRCSNADGVAQHTRIDVTSLEKELKTVYTVDTIRRLKRARPHVKFVWIMGADNLIELAGWKEWRSLFQIVPVAVFNRSTDSLSVFRSEAARAFIRVRVPDRNSSRLLAMDSPAWIFIRSELHPGSATSIRRKGIWKWS